MVKTSINALLLHMFSDKDTVTMVVEINSMTLWITSSYLAHDYGLSPPQEPLIGPFLEKLEPGVNLLLRRLEHSCNDAIAYADDIAIARLEFVG